MKEIALIVNHYQSPHSLKMVLGYVRQWQREYEMRNGEGTTEVLVTDSATTRQTFEMMRAYFPSFTFLPSQKNIGFGRSVNNALRQVSAEIVFVMNADLVIPNPQELDNLIRYLKEHQDVGIVAPKLCNFDNTLQHSAFRFYTPLTIFIRRTFLQKLGFGKKRIRRFLLQGEIEKVHMPYEVDWVMGSAFLMRMQHFTQVGFFDERFFMYMEDVDLCRRVWEAGLKVVYYPESVMYHFHNKASRSNNMLGMLLNRYTYIHFISAIKYFSKHRNKPPARRGA